MYEVDQSTGAVGDPVLGNDGSEGGNSKWTKLWENPDISLDFAAQVIDLDSDNYDFLLFINLYVKGTKRQAGQDIISKDVDSFDLHVFNVWGTSPSGSFIGLRSACSFVSSTRISISNCETSSGSTRIGQDNTRCIPYQVYGIKM